MGGVVGLGSEFVPGSVLTLKPKVLTTSCLLNEAKIYGDLGKLDLINKPTGENPREEISLLSPHQYGSRTRIPI